MGLCAFIAFTRLLKRKFLWLDILESISPDHELMRTGLRCIAEAMTDDMKAECPYFWEKWSKYEIHIEELRVFAGVQNSNQGKTQDAAPSETKNESPK
jgi:hypothetical protein